MPYRPWSPEKRRNGYNIGRFADSKCRLRGINARQNDATGPVENSASLSLITSTQAVKTRDKPKPLNSLLNPAGSGDTAFLPCAFFNEPRAAFYTDNGVKMQNKKAVFAALPGKFSVTICDRMWRASKNAGNKVKS
ncbi:hypothetical protein PF050_04090 [Kosakonia pseudosacchari]|nr:hypothetical protein [Kosakonia pseudosacchari]WBU50121.1 hypothetical protein PF050_04090 [Kosakonia pseudosacchari]